MTGFLVWLLRVLILLVIVRLVMQSVSSITGRRAARRPAPPRVAVRAGGTLVRDPHCGTYIPESSALVVGSGSDALHFCSATCRDAWTAAHGRARAKA